MRHAIAVGWLGGMIVILAGLPWPAGCLVPAAGAGSVLAWRRWGAGIWTAIRLRVRLPVLRKRIPESGGAVERA